MDYGFNRIILESVQIKCLISLPPGDLSLPIFAEALVRLRYLKCKRDGSFFINSCATPVSLKGPKRRVCGESLSFREREGIWKLMKAEKKKEGRKREEEEKWPNICQTVRSVFPDVSRLPVQPINTLSATECLLLHTHAQMCSHTSKPNKHVQKFLCCRDVSAIRCNKICINVCSRRIN